MLIQQHCENLEPLMNNHERYKLYLLDNQAFPIAKTLDIEAYIHLE
jgi:hypothetical protein